jgi:hypothetical protein
VIFPTDIPHHLHVDLEGDEVLNISPAEDRLVQLEMVRTHAYFLGMKLGRSPSLNEAFISWYDSGLALVYRKHYRWI